MASAAIRLYFQTVNPCLNLRKFMNFVVNVYAPVLFDIKKYGHVTFGAKHFFNLIRSGMDHLTTVKERKKFQDSILNNNFFG